MSGEPRTAHAAGARGFARRLASGPKDFLAVVVRNRALVRELVMRDLKGGHAGHGLGSLWIYIQPLVVVATYILIFGLVLGARIAPTASFPGDYTSYVLTGLVPWLIMHVAMFAKPSSDRIASTIHSRGSSNEPA